MDDERLVVTWFSLRPILLFVLALNLLLALPLLAPFLFDDGRLWYKIFLGISLVNLLLTGLTTYGDTFFSRVVFDLKEGQIRVFRRSLIGVREFVFGVEDVQGLAWTDDVRESRHGENLFLRLKDENERVPLLRCKNPTHFANRDVAEWWNRRMAWPIEILEWKNEGEVKL